MDTPVKMDDGFVQEYQFMKFYDDETLAQEVDCDLELHSISLAANTFTYSFEKEADPRPTKSSGFYSSDTRNFESSSWMIQYWMEKVSSRNRRLKALCESLPQDSWSMALFHETAYLHLDAFLKDIIKKLIAKAVNEFKKQPDESSHANTGYGKAQSSFEDHAKALSSPQPHISWPYLDVVRSEVP